MSLLFKRSEQRATVIPPDTLAKIIRADYGYRVGGVFVDSDSAMRHDAVWACVTKIAQDVSMMPVDVVRYQGDTRVNIPPPPIITNPSTIASPLDWRYQIIVSWLRDGNAWGLVTKTTADMSYPTRIELIAHQKVHPQVTDRNVLFFIDGVQHDLWPLGDLWHVPAYTMPGFLLGLSPIAYHATSIGVGIAAEKFGADFFQDGGHPSAIIGVEGTPTDEQAKTLKEKLLNLTRGNRELLVMSKATSYQPLQVNPNDSQFLDAMKYSVEQICRVYGEDPADYGASGGAGSTSLTYANRSDADLARFKRRQFWVTKLQNVLTDLLPRPQVVRLNTSSALMMTDAERWAIHDLRLKNKTTTINEVRKLEDETPFADPEFDAPGVGGVAQPLAQMVRELTPGVGVLFTSDEGRTLLNENGAGLTVPGPPELEPAKAITPATAPVPANTNGGGNAP